MRPFDTRDGVVVYPHLTLRRAGSRSLGVTIPVDALRTYLPSWELGMPLAVSAVPPCMVIEAATNDASDASDVAGDAAGASGARTLVKLRAVGNSAGVVVPAAIARTLGWELGTRVVVAVLVHHSRLFVNRY